MVDSIGGGRSTTRRSSSKPVRFNDDDDDDDDNNDTTIGNTSFFAAIAAKKKTKNNNSNKKKSPSQDPASKTSNAAAKTKSKKRGSSRGGCNEDEEDNDVEEEETETRASSARATTRIRIRIGNTVVSPPTNNAKNNNKRNRDSSEKVAKYEVGDVVEVLYEDDNDDETDWYEATILKKKLYHGDTRYDVHYTIDDASQSNVSEENIRPPSSTTKSKKVKNNSKKDSPPPPKKKASTGTTSEFSAREIEALDKLAAYLECHGGEQKQSKLFTCKVHQRPEGRYESIFYNDENKRFKSMADVARSLDLTVVTIKKRSSSSKYYDSDASSNDSVPKKRAKKTGREANDVMVDPLMQSMALSKREEEAMEKLALYLEERGGTRRQSETFTCTAKQRPCGRYESFFFNDENKRFKSMADVARSLDISTVLLSGIFGGGAATKTPAKLTVSVQTVKVCLKMNDSSSEGDEDEEEGAPLYAKLDTIVAPPTSRDKEEMSVVKNEEVDDDAKISASHTNLLDSIGKFSHGRPVPLNPKGLLHGEPKKPKNAPNSFALFCADAKNTMPEILDGMGGPGKMTDRTRVIAAKWNSMDEASKQKYKDLAVLAKKKQNKLMDQYKIDMEEFIRLNPGVVTSADLAKDAKAAVKEALTSALDFPPSATPEEVISIKSQSKGKYCAYEDCTRYRQSGCYGYCLTHRHCADPEAHALIREKANEEVNKKKFLMNKSHLCKWPECIRYIQSNCHGYCLTHVKYADYMGEGERGDGDGDDWLNDEGEDLLYEVTKVRVRLDSKLQQGFCKAILPQELRNEWGFIRYEDGEDYNLDRITGDDVTDNSKSDGKKQVCLEVKESESNVNSDEKKDDDEELVSANTSSDDVVLDDHDVPKQSKIKYSDDLLDFAVSAKCQKKPNGANKCRALYCDKNCQGNSDGFCRQHHNQYLINTGQCNSWDCICGGQVPDIMARCGTCHRWRDGKHPLESSSSSATKRAKSEVAEENIIEEDDNVESWKCDCGNMVPGGKIRCGQCHHWKGGKRQGGWKLGSLGRDYDSDEDVDRTQDWECCGVIISAQKTRCGKCNGWRNGKRIAAAAVQSKKPWLCAKCHISNPASRRRCGGCLTWKAAPSHTAAVAVMRSLNDPSKPKLKASVGFVGNNSDESGDQWKCTQCSFGNFATQLECSNCDEFRPNYQWYKKQQDILSVTAASVVTAPTPQPSQPAISVVTQAATSTAIQPPISGPPDDLNYYGTFDEELGYPEISIHYDFNRAYYHNNNYSYLNKSVVRSSDNNFDVDVGKDI